MCSLLSVIHFIVSTHFFLHTGHTVQGHLITLKLDKAFGSQANFTTHTCTNENTVI